MVSKTVLSNTSVFLRGQEGCQHVITYNIEGGRLFDSENENAINIIDKREGGRGLFDSENENTINIIHRT